MRDLHIWSLQHPVDLEPIRRAKGLLGADFQVRPVEAETIRSLPTLETRVLAVGSRPPFLCEYALVSDRTSVEGMVRALRWVLGIVSVDEKATTIEDTLNSFMGPGVREVSQEELDARQRLRDYQQNRV